MGNRQSSAGLSANKLLKTDDLTFAPPPSQSAEVSIAPRRLMPTDLGAPPSQSADFSMAPRRPMSTNFQPMQQAAPVAMAPRRLLATDPIAPVPIQPSAPSMAPRKPLETNPAAAASGLAPRQLQQTPNAFHPSMVSNMIMPRMDYRRLQSTADVSQDSLFDDDANIDSYDVLDEVINETLSLPMPSIGKAIAETYTFRFVSLRDNAESIFVSSPLQIRTMQQSKLAQERLPMLEPPSLNPKDFDHILHPGHKLNASEAVLSTNELTHEIEALKELLDAGFIHFEEYCQRLGVLEHLKQHSSVLTVPHADLGLAQSRRQEGPKTKSRNVRLFISSTFRDMSDEREALLKSVLPRLQEWCKARGVFLTCVDLRWGITTEDTNTGTTIKICLSEIDRCRPYFVCMLGNRYGWSQPNDAKKPKDSALTKTFDVAALEFDWIRKYDDRSVTELEVRHAVLNDISSPTAQRALFYLRSSKGGNVDDDPRQSKLKNEVESNSNLRVKRYAEIARLTEYLYTDLEKLLEADFPMQSLPSPLEKERMAHEAFEETRARVYIGRQYYFDTINSHLAGDIVVPMVVIGGSGLGKSAFMCNWTVQYRESHPTTLVVAHYIGSTPQSTDLGRLLQRVISEIKEYYKLDRSIPQDLKDLIEAFPQWLGEASRRGGMVLVLDALNQLDPRYNAHDLNWLPASLPPSVKLLACRKRGYKPMEIQPLSVSERKSLASEYLGMYGKKLTDAQLQRIVNAKQCENALFLRTLLEELRVFGIFEKLDERIGHYLTAETPPRLFELAFARLDSDFESAQSKGLVGSLLSLLWVSRKGLSETEITEVLGINSSTWSPLFIAMTEMVVSKSGSLTFFHDYMRQAVEQRYLKPRNEYNAYRDKLVAHFSAPGRDQQRRLEEVPYQLERAGRWRDLSQFISKFESFKALFDSEHKFDLYRYWRSCSENSNAPDAAFIASLKEFVSSKKSEEVSHGWGQAADFYQDIGQYEQAEVCAKSALQELERGGQNPALLADKRQNLAYILRLKGHYAEAQPLYEKALEYLDAQPDGDKRTLAQAINSLAILCRLQGNYDKAEPLYERALAMRRALFGSVHEDVAQSLNSLGCLHQDMGRYESSEKLLQEAVQQREQILGSNHPDLAMSLNNLGGLYLDWSKYGLAEPCYLRAKAIYEVVYGPSHPYVAKAINSLAGLYQEQGKYADAEVLYQQTLLLKEKLLGPNHPDLALTLNDYAVLYARQDKFSDALMLYQRARDIREHALGKAHPDYAQSVKNIASLYQDQRRYSDAERLFKEALDITEKAFGPRHQDVATCLTTLAGCYQLMGRFDEAQPLYDRALGILIEKCGENHTDVALALNDMAVLAFRRRDIAKAEQLYLKALKTYETLFGASHPNVGDAVLNIAQFYKGVSQKDKAIKFYNRAVDIFTSQFGSQHSKTLKAQEEAKALA